jgi:hypothetical protein
MSAQVSLQTILEDLTKRFGPQIEETRTFKPGGVYYLRVEANSPGYDLELRLRDPAPYTDPRRAVRQAMYDHLSQVDAWLLNRPRGAGTRQPHQARV